MLLFHVFLRASACEGVCLTVKQMRAPGIGRMEAITLLFFGMIGSVMDKSSLLRSPLTPP